VMHEAAALASVHDVKVDRGYAVNCIIIVLYNNNVYI
jgi:hypothetical protein